jgi:hypothetical protein
MILHSIYTFAYCSSFKPPLFCNSVIITPGLSFFIKINNFYNFLFEQHYFIAFTRTPLAANSKAVHLVN